MVTLAPGFPVRELYSQQQYQIPVRGGDTCTVYFVYTQVLMSKCFGVLQFLQCCFVLLKQNCKIKNIYIQEKSGGHSLCIITTTKKSYNTNIQNVNVMLSGSSGANHDYLHQQLLVINRGSSCHVFSPQPIDTMSPSTMKDSSTQAVKRSSRMKSRLMPMAITSPLQKQQHISAIKVKHS